MEQSRIDQIQQEAEARNALQRLGVEIDLSDNRPPTEILAGLGAIGIKEATMQPSLAKRRSVSPYLAF